MYEGVNNEKSPSALPPATKVTTNFLCGFPEIVYVHRANVYKSMVLSLSFTNVSFTVSCTQLGIYLVILLWAAGPFALLLFTAAQCSIVCVLGLIYPDAHCFISMLKVLPALCCTFPPYT